MTDLTDALGELDRRVLWLAALSALSLADSHG